MKGMSRKPNDGLLMAFRVRKMALLVPLCALLLLGSSTRRNNRFEDNYDCYIIVDVEISPYGEDDFEQIDCDLFMETIARGKHVPIAFRPDYEATLYDDDGVRYKLYISKSCTYFCVGSDCYKLSRARRKRLQSIIS